MPELVHETRRAHHEATVDVHIRGNSWSPYRRHRDAKALHAARFQTHDEQCSAIAPYHLPIRIRDSSSASRLDDAIRAVNGYEQVLRIASRHFCGVLFVLKRHPLPAPPCR